MPASRAGAVDSSFASCAGDSNSRVGFDSVSQQFGNLQNKSVGTHSFLSFRLTVPGGGLAASCAGALDSSFA